MKRFSAVMAGLLCAGGLAHADGHAAVKPALSGQLGLYAASDFRLSKGDCTDCPEPRQGLWYFRGDTIAVPRDQVAGFDRHQRAQDDIRQWLGKTQGKGDGSHPALVWIGSPEQVQGRLSRDAGRLTTAGGEKLPLQLVAKIDSNLSYFNGDSEKYFAGREVKLRGSSSADGFTARTLWPVDSAIPDRRLPLQPLATGENLAALIRADNGGASSPQQNRLLWSRDGQPASIAGKPVMAFVLNGAQGDDDEAHGGHFAVATGRFGDKGEWDNWLVNNFYNLDSFSEKGIIASTLPMDAYQGDLNSGQSWYRPSYMLVAVFRDARVPELYQEAIGRTFNHFYRHDFRYHHALANCAGINLNTLRTLGWSIPERGSDSRLKALAALPYLSVKEGSLEDGRKAYDYLTAEKTALYPFVAFEAVGDDLLQRLSQGKPAKGAYEQAISEDLEAILFVRLPQFPSSRAMGQAPVASLDEFMARVPANRADWKAVPVPPRPFPAEMKDAEAPAEETAPSTIALYGYGLFLAMGGMGGWRWRQRRKNSLSGEKQ